MKILWFIPTHGDWRYLGTAQGARGRRPSPTSSRSRIAADSLGYDGVLIPTGRSCEDSWIARRRLIAADASGCKFLVALRPGLRAADAVARAWRPRSTGCPAGGCWSTSSPAAIRSRTGRRRPVPRPRRALRGHAASSSHLARALLAEARPSTSTASTSSVKGGKLLLPAGAAARTRRCYFGGSSEAAHELAAEQVDTYLTWGEPPADGGREDRPTCARAPRSTAATLQLRHPPARHRARDRRRGLAAADELIADARRRDDRRGAGASSRRWTRSASAAWPRCTAAGATSSRSAPTCGPASAWCAAAPARRWSATPETGGRRASRSTGARASTPSSCPATRTWKRPTASPNWCSRCCRWTAAQARAAAR